MMTMTMTGFLNLFCNDPSFTLFSLADVAFGQLRGSLMKMLPLNLTICVDFKGI